MKEISERDSILGLAGEVFVESHCRLNKLEYKKGSTQDDLVYGVDAYISKLPTDIKNTQYLFPCQINKEGLINTRHPYKTTSKATHFLFVNVDGSGQGKFIEHIPVKEKLLRDIVKEEEYDNFLTFLQQIDKKSYLEFGTNLDNASLKIKEKLLSFLKKGLQVSYNTPTSNHDVSFKIKKEDIMKTTKPTIKSIQSIRDLLKERREGTYTEEPKEKYPIIKINI